MPEGSRATQGKSLLPVFINDKSLAVLKSLNELAEKRGQTLAQMAIAWVLRNEEITTALIGASKPEQIIECTGCVNNLDFSAAELQEIDTLANDQGEYRKKSILSQTIKGSIGKINRLIPPSRHTKIPTITVR